MSVHRDIEEAADSLRALAGRLLSGSQDPEQAARKMRQDADELEDLARKVKRAARKE